MIDRIEMHPTPPGHEEFDQRSGKDRRRTHTMLDPGKDQRKVNRRQNSPALAKGIYRLKGFRRF